MKRFFKGLFIFVAACFCASILVNGQGKVENGKVVKEKDVPLETVTPANLVANAKNFMGKTVIIPVKAPLPFDIDDSGQTYSVLPVDSKRVVKVVFKHASNAEDLASGKRRIENLACDVKFDERLAKAQVVTVLMKAIML